ncbi:MAG: tRNA methyltransferase ppm2 [Claussenomyces sp. TS43310]|nr:MAG: tRNA methyltransferase ppm2 [Claussenomyces sp. TS43310]
MAHFDKLKTPLRSIQFYPTIRHQQQRFEDAGWTDVWAKNLWELWASEFLTSEERTSLDEIEPFDEWEEFALFGCHYVLLLAKNDSCPDTVAPKHAIPAEGQLRKDVLVVDNTRFSAYANSGGYRRFAASLPMRGTDHYEGLIGCFGGMGLNTRLKSIDIYSKTALDSTVLDERSRLQAPSARICHTITDLGEAGAVLIGGRASPDQAFTDCWLYNKWKNAWERLKDLPQPRYRHSAVLLRKDMILIMGGKRDSKTIIWEPLLWNREFGWRNCSLKLSGLTDGLPAVFGAILAVTKERPCQGIFTGGMLQDGVINRNTWYWTLNDTDSSSAIMDFKQATSSPGYERPPLDRFGATVISQERRTVVIGGITPDHLIEPQDEIVSLEGVQNEDLSNSHTVDRLLTSSLRPRPLLIGCSARQSEHELVLMGGGAVCFSMGTFWNSGCYTLPIGGGHISEQCHTHNQEPNSWHYSRTIEIPNGSPFLPKRRAPTASGARAVQRLIVDHEIVDTTAEFSEIVKRGKPAVFPNVDLGSCTQAWSSSYLTNRVGRDRRIVVHKASTEHMDFVSKNFDYVKMSFGDFTDAIDKGERLYLRSLSSNKPSELPADIFEDYPTICNDFRLPPAFQQVIENAHSSPLRISGPVTMWLHYDVMANVLCQIRGSKHLLLFPPADLQHFDFAPGASSSSMDVFHMLDDARLAQTRPHEATLNAGDVLFIPPLWLHTAKPTEEVSINVNIFFRNFRHGYAIGRDVYGNRDLAAYEKGRKDISKIAKSFDGLPADVRGFYLLRLAQELHVEAETLIDCE